MNENNSNQLQSFPLGNWRTWLQTETLLLLKQLIRLDLWIKINNFWLFQHVIMRKALGLVKGQLCEQILDSLTPANPTQPPLFTLWSPRGNLPLACQCSSKASLSFLFWWSTCIFFVLHFMHSRHFTLYSLYEDSVNTVGKASHQLKRADCFYEIN